MMRQINKIILVLSMLFYTVSGTAQQTANDSLPEPVPFESSLNLIGKFSGDSVILRWGPDKPGAWSYANSIGYTLERVSLDADGAFDAGNYMPLTTQPIKPLPLDDWQALTGTEGEKAMAAIAAQALYGQDFNVSQQQALFEQADAYQTRFSFALLAADLSPLAANGLGLRYVDKDIEKDKTYIYRVFISKPSEIYKTDTVYFVMNTDVAEATEKPILEKPEEGEKSVTISWRRDWHNLHFSGYYIQKASKASGPWETLNKVPYIQPVGKNLPSDNQFIMYTDSLEKNYVTFYYRIVGITPFGEKSPPSEAIGAMGRDKTPPPAPVEVKAESLGGQNVQITWQMPSETDDLAGFYIGRSNESNRGFEPLHEKPLSKKTRSFTDNQANTLTANYYLVAAVDTAGNGAVSMVAYGMIIDSIPPPAPVGLKGEIDSSGVVTLTWPLSPAQDVAGYMVYFANDESHTFTALTDRPYTDTVYYDTIKIKTLTETIYYKIRAVDVNYNYSADSRVLEVKKPDIVPPTQAVFTRYLVNEAGILLEWVPSSSEDVAKHILYRKTNEAYVPMVEIASDKNTNRFLDRGVKPGVLYTYVLKAVDDDGLESPYSVPVKARMADFSKVPAVEKINIRKDTDKQQIFLSWSYSIDDNYRFILYKATNGSMFNSIESLNKGENSYLDNIVKPGNTYEYTIKVKQKNGKESGFGTIVKVEF